MLGGGVVSWEHEMKELEMTSSTYPPADPCCGDRDDMAFTELDKLWRLGG